MKRHLLAALSLAACGDPSATSDLRLPTDQAPVTPPLAWRTELPIGDVTGAVPLDLPTGPALLTSLNSYAVATHQILRLGPSGTLVGERLDLAAPTCAMDRGDVDGDGIDELVLATEDGIELRHPSTLALISTFAAVNPNLLRSDCAVHARDLDGDGIAEILLTDDDQGDVEIFDGAGNVLEVFSATYHGAETYSGLVFAELDGTPGVEIILNHRGDLVDGDLRSLGTLAAVTSGDHNVVATAAADVDGDGIEEIAVVTDREQVSLYRAFTNDLLWSTTVEGYPSGLVLTDDLNGDGAQDLIVTTADVPGEPTLLLLDGQTGLVEPLADTGHHTDYPQQLLRWQANATGQPELIFFGGTHAALLGADGDILTTTPMIGGNPLGTFVGDFDGDGGLDVVVVPELARGDVLLLDGQTGALRAALPLSGNHNAPLSATTADVDGDGRPELVLYLPSAYHGLVDHAIFAYSVGVTGLTTVLELPYDVLPHQMIAVDVDRDGTDELWTHNLRNEACLIRLDGAPGGWCRPVPSVRAVEVGDLDNDGTPELLALARDRGMAVLRASDGGLLAVARGSFEDIAWHEPLGAVLATHAPSDTLRRYTLGVGGLLPGPAVPLPHPAHRELWVAGGLVWFGGTLRSQGAEDGEVLGVDPIDAERVTLPARWPDVDNQIAAAGRDLIHADGWTVTRYNR